MKNDLNGSDQIPLEKNLIKHELKGNVEQYFFRASANDFMKIPGNTIAYWISEKMRNVFNEGSPLKDIGDTRQGMATSDNNRFLRVWSEVSFDKAYFFAKTREEPLTPKGEFTPSP